MNKIDELMIITKREMDEVGFKSFFEQNMTDCKVSVLLASASYNFNDFNISELSDKCVVLIDADDFDHKKLIDFLRKLKINNKICIIYSKLNTPGLFLKAHQLMLGGYISKSSSMTKFLDCLTAIEYGGVYYDSIFAPIYSSLNELSDVLSQMEKNLLYEILMYDYISIKNLAENQNISKHAAEVHLSHLYKKTKTSSYKELIKKFSI